MPARREKIMKTVWKTAMYLLTAWAIVHLAREGMFSGNNFVFSSAAWLWLCAGCAAYALSVGGLALRFHLLMRLMRISPPPLDATVRCFFHGLLPQLFGTQLAFDALRAYFLGKRGVAAADIAGSVLVDRLLGIAAFLFFSLTGLAVIVDSRRFLPAVLAALALSLALPSALIGWRALVAGGRFPFLKSLPGSAFLCEMAVSLLRLKGQKRRFMALQCLAIAAQFCQLSCIYCAARALDGSELSLFETTVSGSLASLVGLLPLPLSGLGVSESVFGAVASEMRRTGGAADFAPVFLLNRLIAMAMAVAAWIFVRDGDRTEDAAARAEEGRQ